MRLALPLVLALGCSTKPTRTVRVAAAADLARAFEELGKQFEAKTHITPVFTFDSSGLLAKRIDQGAPYALFASAGKTFIDDVVAHASCDAQSVRSYARGKIVVWTKDGIVAPATFADLKDPRFARIAIANPEHAPYGRAAKQALEKAGVWDAIKDRVKYGENVQATMQYATSGAVDAAIVALSLAKGTTGGTALEVDTALYDPLDQQLVVCTTGDEGAAAKELADFITSDDGRAVMAKYGFEAPSK